MIRSVSKDHIHLDQNINFPPLLIILMHSKLSTNPLRCCPLNENVNRLGKFLQVSKGPIETFALQP